MTLVWSDFNVQTYDNTLMIWRCPPDVKETFINTFNGPSGEELVLHPMLVHAFFAEQILTLTYDFLSIFSESIYEWV